MNPITRLSLTDQRIAAYRDYAEHCREMFDELIKQEFTRDEAVMLVLPLIDVVLGAQYVAST